MLALQISSTKQFMNHLLTGDTFSSFLLENATVTTFNTFTIDGRVHPEFFTDSDTRTDAQKNNVFSEYLSLRDHLYSVVKGSRTPLSMKITLLLNPQAMEKLLQNNGCENLRSMISGFALNIKYDGSKITLTTAISYEGFTMDKSAEPVWDTALKKFLSAKEIAYEEI